MSSYLDGMSNEAKESFEWLVTYIKSTKADVEKATLKRLEDASNRLSKEHLHRVVGQLIDSKISIEFTEKVFVYAKYIIIKQMAIQNQHDIAVSYSKKVIFEHSRNCHIQRSLIEKLSKSGIKLDKVLKLIKEIALEQISAKTFDYLFRAASLEQSSIVSTCNVFETKLHCTRFMRDTETWIQYISFLKHQSKHIEAR